MDNESFAALSRDIMNLPCKNPNPEDNCGLYNIGHRDARRAAAELVNAAAATAEQLSTPGSAGSGNTSKFGSTELQAMIVERAVAAPAVPEGVDIAEMWRLLRAWAEAGVDATPAQIYAVENFVAQQREAGRREESKITWPEVSAAAQIANQQFGQWMPERWVQLFVAAYNKE